MLISTQATHTHTWYACHFVYITTQQPQICQKPERTTTKHSRTIPSTDWAAPVLVAHSWLNIGDDNNNTHTHTQRWAAPRPRPPPAQQQPRQCGWGRNWRHRLLLSKQQKPLKPPTFLNTEGQCETTKHPVHHLTLSSSFPCITHGHDGRHTEGTERHRTGLQTRASVGSLFLGRRSDRTRRKLMKLRVGGNRGGVPLFHLLDYGWQ